MEQQEQHLPSEELQEFMKANGNLSVEELAILNPEELLTYQGFSWRIMLEVLNFSKFDELE